MEVIITKKLATISGKEKSLSIDLASLENVFGKGNVLWWRVADSVLTMADYTKPENLEGINITSPNWLLKVILEDDRHARPDPSEKVSSAVWEQVKLLVWNQPGEDAAIPYLSRLLTSTRTFDQLIEIECEHCGEVNKRTAKFCNMCGAQIERQEIVEGCPKCGETDHKQGARFCYLCGTPLFAESEIHLSEDPKNITLEGIEFKLINPGNFIMGNDRYGPPHNVFITKHFYIGIYPITQNQYQKIVGSNPSKFKYHTILGGNPSKKNIGDRPVESLNWAEAIDFCRRLSQITGRIVRLPTEAEWEYSCRAGTETDFYWGDVFSPSYAWTGKSTTADRGPNMVGHCRPNNWGLYDMAGNVWEWCQDWFAKYKKEDQIDPTGPAAGDCKILRGGSWDTKSEFCASAVRRSINPVIKYSDNGLRCLVEID